MRSVGVPEPFVPFLLGIQLGIREGALEVESDDFAKLLGRPATSLEEGIREIVNGVQS